MMALPSPRQDRADPQGQSGEGQPASSVLTPRVTVAQLRTAVAALASACADMADRLEALEGEVGWRLGDAPGGRPE